MTPRPDEFASADALWVEVGDLYKNRGPDRPGNQLDLPKGARTFFGFLDEDVPRNTVLGHIRVRVIGYESDERSVRYADNSMDKLNLPVPGSTKGPATYDGKTLLIERDADEDGEAIYLFTPGEPGAQQQWKRRYGTSRDFRMGSGRNYGLLNND